MHSGCTHIKTHIVDLSDAAPMLIEKKKTIIGKG